MLNLWAPVTFSLQTCWSSRRPSSRSSSWCRSCGRSAARRDASGYGNSELVTMYKASSKSWLLYGVPQKGLSYSQKNGQTWIWPKIWPTRVTNFTFYSENVRNISSWFTQPSISSIFQSTPLSTGLTTRVAEFARKISTVSRDSLPPSYSRCDLRRLVQIK